MIETERLILREWQERDRAPFAAVNADPRVMKTLGSTATRAESDALVDRLKADQDELGHTLWAAEQRQNSMLIGCCGVVRGDAGTPVSGQLEIGWRLAYDSWGFGLAREAAEAVIAWCWSDMSDDEVVAITALTNQRSWGLMKRLGMRRDAGADFDHPRVPADSPLLRHCTYRIARPVGR